MQKKTKINVIFEIDEAELSNVFFSNIKKRKNQFLKHV
jgi:hypothetical protein